MSRFLSIDNRPLMIGFLAGIVLIASLCISTTIPASELAFPFVHAALEALGSFLAIVVAWHSLTTYLANPHESHRVWVGLAFLNMGILYGLHALVAPGDLSIWFRSCATFIGGAMAMLVWIPSPAHRKVPVGWALIICISSYPLLGIVFFRNPQLVPHMIDQKDMTWVTTFFTVSGGVAFLGSAVWFLRHLKHSSHWEPMRQASCYVSIGMSEICFTWSTLWDPMWWWWHGVRLFSYGIVAYSAKTDFEQGLIRQTERALEAEENVRLRFVVESAPCGMLMVGSDGTISMVNHQLEVLFGYDRNELVGSPSHTLLPERFRTTLPGIEELHIHASFPLISVRHGRALFGLRKDGTEFPIEVGFSHIELNSAKQILATVVDITERKQAERQLEQQTAELSRSNRELEQFAYVASHDLQEPLRMVSSYCGLLARRYKGKLDRDADEFIQFAVDGATRMKDLIDDLLAYSRVGRQEKPLVMVDAGESVRSALANLEIAIKETGASIIYAALPRVIADPVQLTQVFQNLISNALKFRGSRRPVIHVSARHSNERQAPIQWMFSIQDNGIGFEPQFQKRVFVIFQRLHTREEYEGNGIGLAITKKIIERHGGTIWVESTPGTGTTFFFTLRGHVSERIDAAA
jgi:PAS domain S-box-containing protein